MADANLLRVIKASAQTTKPAVPAKQPVTPAKPVGRPSKDATKTPAKGVSDDKLVVFFKGEFLAVRNAEGGFYVCQVYLFSIIIKLYILLILFPICFLDGTRYLSRKP